MSVQETINIIPKYIYNSDIISDKFIQEKINEANNNNIIMLARGEGRELWKKYIKDKTIFQWGLNVLMHIKSKKVD